MSKLKFDKIWKDIGGDDESKKDMTKNLIENNYKKKTYKKVTTGGMFDKK
jgi:hypothetical protein